MRYRMLFLLLTLTACGFQPLHGQAYRAQQKVDLSAIRIEVNNSRLGQLLKSQIEEGINPDYQRGEKRYTLSIGVTEQEIYLFINPDGTSSRGDIQYDSTYQLIRNRDRKQIDAGSLSRVSSYNTSEQADYASYVAEEDARKRGIVELAQDYQLRISNLLVKLNPERSRE